MRVVLVGPYSVDPERIGGGVETALKGLVSGLATRADVDPHVVTFAPELDAPIRKDVDGVAIDYLPGARRLGNLTLHRRERRLLQRVLARLRPDLVHAQDTLRHGYVSLRAAAPGTPVVISVHGIVREELRYAKGRARLQIGMAGLAMERYCIGHGQYFVQSTPYPEQVFGSKTTGRFADVRNPIPSRFFTVDRSPETGRIVYSGAVIPRKRLLDLVEAMPRVIASIPDSELYAAGAEVDSEYSTRVRARVRQLGLDHRVHLLGALSPEDVLDQYRRASLFVLPSGQETSPLAIGEAMAVGLPIVASDTGGVRYLVENEVTGYVVEIGDVTVLAGCIVRLLGRPEEAARFGMTARDRAERDFRPQVTADRICTFYAEAMEETGGRE